MVKLMGVMATLAAIEKITNEIDNKRKIEAVDSVAEKVEESMKAHAPRDEGELYEDIHIEEQTKARGLYIVRVGPSDDLKEKGSLLPYPVLLEHGTSKMEARAFVRPAHDDNIDEMEKAAVGMFKH